jgi:hypothetical protein
MEELTLVTHKTGKFKGIGCITKVLKASVKVNHGEYDVISCKPKDLEVVDVNNSKTIIFSDLRKMNFTNSNKLPKYAIIGNSLKEYVGIGWIHTRVVTEADLKVFPRVIA